MPVMVTGASGFLGGRLAQVLLREGESVTVLARVSSDLDHLAGSARLRVVRGSLCDPSPLREAVQDATCVIHCAAASTDWARPEVYAASNVRGTRMLLEAACSVPLLERFVHISTTDVYGYPVEPCSEAAPLRDVGLPYNSTKVAAEEAVWRVARESGLPVTVIRPATIYGPRGKAFGTDIAALLQQRAMAYIGGGSTTGGFLYIDNAVEAILAAARSPAALGEVYNLSDGTEATWREYVTLLAEGLGCKLPWINLPWGAALRLAGALEAPYRWIPWLPGRPPLTRHAVYLLGRDQEFPAEKARRDLGFLSRVSLEAGVGRLVEWLKARAAV